MPKPGMEPGTTDSKPCMPPFHPVLLFLVHDALPMILQDTTGTDRKILLNWLDKAMQYYLVTAFSSLNKSGTVYYVSVYAQRITLWMPSLSNLGLVNLLWKF